MDKATYIMMCLHHAKRIGWPLINTDILFFLYYADVPLDTAKEYIEIANTRRN